METIVHLLLPFFFFFLLLFFPFFFFFLPPRIIICFKGLDEGSELNTTDRDRDGYEGQLD